MVEVGTTNRTHLKDYADNINENTALIFRAHPSNYKIIGFTKDVDNRQLAELAHKQDKIFINDIGSGYLKELPINALVSEPSVVKSLDEGADLVSFSCDKLLGGCQGGIIIGKKELIEKLSSNPLMRVFRVGKTTISILNSVLTGFLRESERKERIPVYRYLERSLDEQRTIAEELKSLLDKVGIGSSIEPCYGYVGGGSVPEEKLDSWQVLLDPKQFPRQEAAGIQKALMHGSIPVVGMMDNGRFGFKVLTLEMHHLNNIVESLMQIISKAGNL
jgi:L-seryl-tRNA(Ser) seleniumtransferase